MSLRSTKRRRLESADLCIFLMTKNVYTKAKQIDVRLLGRMREFNWNRLS